MDTDALVSEQIEEGRALLFRLVEAGDEVTVAAWAQRAEDCQWVFIIATPLVDQRGLLAAYGEVLRVLRLRETVWVVSDDISLIDVKHPRAVELLRIRERISGRLAGRFKPTSLAGLPVREVYVYPERLRTELSESEKQLLAHLYALSPLPVDALPYTEQMEQIHLDFVRQTGVGVSVGELFGALLNLRKQGRLSRKLGSAEAGVAAPVPPAETA